MRDSFIKSIFLSGYVFFAIGVAQAQDLPAITASTFNVSVTAQSKSGRVYIFKDSRSSVPSDRRILLLKREGKNAMAFRVLKRYKADDQFAASRVRLYETYKRLPIGENFLAVEKISDYFPPRSAETVKRDQKELLELEKETFGAEQPESTENEVDDFQDDDLKAAPKKKNPPSTDDEGDEFEDEEDDSENTTKAFDPELDQPVGLVDNEEDLSLNDDDRFKNLIIEERKEFDPDTVWLSVGPAFLANNELTKSSDGKIANLSRTYFTGAGFSLGFTLSKFLAFKENEIQDSLVAEGGLYLYKVVAFATLNDSYTILPFRGILRYNVLLSEDFYLFGYVGFLSNFILAASNGTTDGTTALRSTHPGIGVGTFVRLGPRWFLRGDLGLENLSVGITLRF